MTVCIRLMTRDDIPVGMRLKDAAGWNQTVADWERLLAADPYGSFAAEFAGRVVGTATTIIYEGRLAWIGMVIVDRQHRGKGIGTTLLERAIRYLDSRNVPSIKLDATPQGKPLYEQFGFVKEYDVERWALHRSGGKQVEGEVSAAIQDALELDREVFGADRSALLRSLTQAVSAFTLVARRDGEVAGYAFGRRGSLADHLGPWMARDEAIAANLLEEFVRRSGRDCVFVDCIRPNPWAVRLVQARGFEFSRPLTRMVRGANTYPGRPELLGAAVGPEFG